MRWRTAVAAAAATALVVLPTGAADAAPPPGIPTPTGGYSVAALLDGRITLAGADAPLEMPMQTLRVYAYESDEHAGDIEVATSRAWIVRRAGAHPTYGLFAPVTASANVNGHVLVATVSQQQVVDASSHAFLPLVITTRSPGTTEVRGSTVLHVDAVQLDGAPVDVGTGCVSAWTVDIALTGARGWTDFKGGLLKGTFTVPPFVGCDGAETGLTDLLTGAFSGPGNTVTLARGAAGVWDTTAPRDCRDCTRPPAIR